MNQRRGNENSIKVLGVGNQVAKRFDGTLKESLKEPHDKVKPLEAAGGRYKIYIPGKEEVWTYTLQNLVLGWAQNRDEDLDLDTRTRWVERKSKSRHTGSKFTAIHDPIAGPVGMRIQETYNSSTLQRID